MCIRDRFRVSLLRGPRGRDCDVAADRAEGTKPAVGLVRGVGKGSGSDEGEQVVERLVDVGRMRIELESLHLPLAGRQEVAGRDLRCGRTRARKELRRGPPIQGVLQETPAAEVTSGYFLLPECVITAGLVVPHGVLVRARLVDPADLALQ